MEKPVKKKSLGKGLSALLGPELREISEIPKDGVKMDLDMMDITPGRYQPRRFFEEQDIRELADSMSHMGILQPILVKRHDNQNYEIIAGERRWRAARLAGMKKIPAIIKDFTDHEMFEAALIENIQRKELSAIEEAEGMADFMDEFGYTQVQLSKRMGKSRSYIANTLRLTTLPLKVKMALLEGKITAGHARALLGSDDPEGIMDQVLSQKMSVRATEGFTKKHPQKHLRKKHPKEKDNDIFAIQEHISKIFNAKVIIDVLDCKGKISIHFTSLQMLDELINKMGRASTSILDHP